MFGPSRPHRHSLFAITIQTQEELMQSVTQINVIAIKPGKTDEFIEAQRRYFASIDLPPA
jgi:hypothetical protein